MSSGYQDHKICPRCGRNDLDPLAECPCPKERRVRNEARPFNRRQAMTTAPQKTEPFKPPFEVLEWYPHYYVRDSAKRTVATKLTKEEADDLVARLSRPSAVVDAGWVLVPREPTVDMVERGREQLSQGDVKVQTHARVMWVWEAMVKAAPKPTEHRGGAAEKLVCSVCGGSHSRLYHP